jgi:hypothetical protein
MKPLSEYLVTCKVVVSVGAMSDDEAAQIVEDTIGQTFHSFKVESVERDWEPEIPLVGDDGSM